MGRSAPGWESGHSRASALSQGYERADTVCMTTKMDSRAARARAALAKSRISRRDWVGDAVVTLVAAAVGVIGVFLPWANGQNGGDVNFSLHQTPGISSAIHTAWGQHALLAAAVVILIGLIMLWAGPRRATAPLGLLSAVAGAVFVISSLHAHEAMMPLFKPGLGLYVTLLTGILLMPIGIASAMVGGILLHAGRAARATEG
jgi:hypothetical protein